MGKTKRRIGSRAMAVLLVLIMVITMMPQVAFAAGGAPAGTGTEADPYQIQDADDLMWFAAQVNGSASSSTSTLYAVLTDNIDLTGKEWTPIGVYNSYSDRVYYGGVFDGNGKTISGLTINNSKQYQALIGYAKGGDRKEFNGQWQRDNQCNQFILCSGNRRLRISGNHRELHQ